MPPNLRLVFNSVWQTRNRPGEDGPPTTIEVVLAHILRHLVGIRMEHDPAQRSLSREMLCLLLETRASEQRQQSPIVPCKWQLRWCSVQLPLPCGMSLPRACRCASYNSYHLRIYGKEKYSLGPTTDESAFRGALNILLSAIKANRPPNRVQRREEYKNKFHNNTTSSPNWDSFQPRFLCYNFDSDHDQ